MKKLIVIVALMTCLVGMNFGAEPNVPVIEPDKAQGLVLWGLTEGNADSTLEARLGFETKYRFEPFVSVKYLTGNPEWGPSPDIVSGGLIYHVNEIGLVADALPDNPWEELLHSLKARPYGGFEIAVPTEGEQRRARTNFIAGALFSNDPAFKWAFSVEYITGDLVGVDNQAVRIGGRFRF